MDKYQERLLRDTNAILLAEQYEKKVSFDGDKLILFQSENYTLEDYVLRIENPQIDYVVVTTDKETKVVSKDNIVSISFKISNLVKLIKIFFKEELADVCEIQVDFRFGDKEIWDNKVREEKQKNLKELFSLTCRTGINILNLFWSNVSKEVENTKLEIYAKEEGKEIFMFEKTFENNIFFFAMDKIAFGKYIVRMKQISKKGEILIEDECSICIDNDIANEISSLTNSLSSGLSDVKNQVAVVCRM